MKTKLTLLAASLFALGSLHSQWTVQNSAFTTPTTGIWSISVVDANVVWATAFDSSWTNAYTDFTRTVNGGTTWTPGTINAPSGFYISCISAINKDTAWVSMGDLNNGGGRIYKTADGGATWTRQNSAAFGGGNGWADAIHFWNANEGVCMGDSNSGYWEFYTTSNGGTTWTRVPQVNIPANVNQEYGSDNVYAVVGNTIWFGTDSGRVYKSTDKGMTWTVAATGLQNITSMAFRDANNGLAEDGGDLVATTDGGATWNLVNSDGNVSDGWMCFAPGNPGAYFSTEYWGDTTGWSSYSTDNGLTWTVIDTLAHGAVGFVNQNIGWSGGWNTSSTVAGMYKWGGTLGIHEADIVNMNVYPDPMNDAAVIVLPANTTDAIFTLYDLSGEKVEELHGISGSKFEIQRVDKAAGIYFFTLQDKTGITGKGKIVIQ